jgi:hypothetical protein
LLIVNPVRKSGGLGEAAAGKLHPGGLGFSVGALTERIELGFMLTMRIHFVACLLLGLAEAVAAAEGKLEPCGTILLPGVEGRFDHFAFDPKGQRLFIAAFGNNSLEIVGIREGRRLQSISGLKKPTGVAYLARWNWICTANGEDGTLRIHDAKTYQPKQIIPGFTEADNLRYDLETDLLYIGYGKGGIGIVEAGQAQVVGMVKLKGHPESFQLESSKHTLFVNVPEARQIAVLDLKKREVMGAWPLGQFQANFPMALDDANHRLLVGCRRPARLLVLDMQSGKAVADVPISEDADDLFFDAKRKRIYVSAGEGFIDVIEQIDADHYRPLPKIPTAAGARTSFFSTDLDVLAVAVPHRGNQPAEIRLFQVH